MTTQPWITCPSCNWSFNLHGDTHMSTRFNCRRARNTGGIRSETAEHYAPTELNRHTGTILQADADRQTEAVKKIMAEQGLNYGPAYDVYIDQQQTRKLRADAVERVNASGIFRPIDPVTKQPVPHPTTAMGHRTHHD